MGISQYMRHDKIRSRAVEFAMTILYSATDWQEAQHALADHDTFGPWLEENYADDIIAEVQSIIREAEHLRE